MRNRVFFPQESLDEWMADDRVDFSGDELTMKGESRRYRVVEAVRVLREVTEGPDANELIGKVKSKAYLAELGAELLDTSMILGENAYDVVPGFVGAPVGSFEEHRKSLGEIPADSASAMSDEELLAAFLAKPM
ncbi:MAG: hypothetical protein IPM79_35320 [Polyangiaceae bacterium]|nr:hypothetical protein [Polyangiaceae bacterium]